MQTHLQKAVAYAALTQYVAFPLTSFKTAAVKIAVLSTKCGQFPLCIHTDTLATACLRSASPTFRPGFVKFG